MTEPTIKSVERALYQVRHLERLPLGTTYPAIVAHVGRLLGKLPGAQLAIDMTGVGRPVFDLFAYNGIFPIGISITGGTSEKYDGRILSVPKLSLISRLQALLHEGKLKIHREIPDAPVLVRELQDYRVEYTPSGQLTFNARAGKHDDLVLALAIAVRVARGDYMSSFGLFELTRQLYHQHCGIPLPGREVIGVDLGQARDATAICVLRRVAIGPAGAQPRDPEAQPIAEPAPPNAYAEGSQQWRDQQEPLPHHTRYFLVRHMDDPNASIGGARQGPFPGTWIVPGNKIDELTAHGFWLVSSEPVNESGVVNG